ncbi:hypothetical protein BDW74DRAFT_162345 [Aspergillus multicolor]|uniref:uncharacterized protein n=1 Tax=Aspergillus multicolor TaxID=41759 RepID=UPI003CCCB4D9
MPKQDGVFPQRNPRPTRGVRIVAALALSVGLLGLPNLYYRYSNQDYPWSSLLPLPITSDSGSPYGQFPLEDDPFHFMPCTNTSLPPPLEDQNALNTWASLFDPDPTHWSWGKLDDENDGPFSDRGIYLCGYLDLPLDYRNDSDTRIVRIAVTKYQVSGLARLDTVDTSSNAGRKSARTIIVEPGGPGGSGTSYVWRAAEDITKRFSDGHFDVLGWDPRGVNISLPSMSCYPDDAIRDRWSLTLNQHRQVSDPESHLQFMDAMNDAKLNSCRERLGDFGRFVSTASVARDLEEIRKALGEDEVSGYFVSYGTGIAQTFANMFPENVGRMILDGLEYVKDHRLLGGFGWTSLDNTTDIWRDGFLGECINAGPEACALARSTKTKAAVTLPQLEARMARLLESLRARPIPAYNDQAGPSVVTYSELVEVIYATLYDPNKWPTTAEMLYELEQGNGTLAAIRLNEAWSYEPSASPSQHGPSSGELDLAVICSDSYDAPLPEDGLDWWSNLWESMTNQSWIAGNSRFSAVLPCQHYSKYWSKPAELYRGDLSHTLKTPLLLISTTYDPATPLRNARRLAGEMGDNARLIVHHGYGHTSSHDRSSCTDDVGRGYMLHGIVPTEREIECHAVKKPYL